MSYTQCVFAKEKIILAADVWCPYNCEPDSKNPGFLIEMAQIIFEEHDIEIEYRLMPWSKALDAVKNGSIHAVVGASKASDRNFIYPDHYQALDVINCYVREEVNWNYSGNASLSGKKLGLILNYKYPYEVSEYIDNLYLETPDKIFFATGNNAVKQNVDSLRDGIIDVYLENANVMDSFISYFKIPDIKKAGSVNVNPTKVYIAFSPEIRKSYIYASMLSRGMVKIRNSGQLADLYKKYGIYTGLEK